MVIDAHINVTRDGCWFGTDIDASLDRALREMDEAGIERAAIVPVVDRDNRDYALQLAATRPDRFIAGYNLMALDGDELAEMRSCLGDGSARFVKIHPRLSGILPLDERLAPFMEAAGHVGRPVMFCTYMRGPSVPMRAIEPLVFDDLARRHPKTTLILGHAGTYRPLDALAVAQSHSNVWLDLSHVLEYFRGSSLEADFGFILAKLDRKVIFGSDFPEHSMPAYLRRAQELADMVKGKDFSGFFGGHARQLLGLSD